LHGAFLHDGDVLPRILNVPIGRLSKLCFPKGFSVYQDLFWNAQVLDRQALLSHQLSGSLQKGISAERTGFPTDVRCKEFEASPLEPLFARVVLDDNEWGALTMRARAASSTSSGSFFVRLFMFFFCMASTSCCGAIIHPL